jgi:hypothetical protein
VPDHTGQLRRQQAPGDVLIAVAERAGAAYVGQPVSDAFTARINSLISTSPSPSTSHAEQVAAAADPNEMLTQMINSLMPTSLESSQSPGQRLTA